VRPSPIIASHEQWNALKEEFHNSIKELGHDTVEKMLGVNATYWNIFKE
jgi:hypothetical protein